MANVKCVYCGEIFDREKVEFCQIPHGKSMRYAHPYHDECIGLPIYGHVCYLCKKADELKNLVPFLGVDGLYAHVDCINKDQPDDREKLLRYIMKLFNVKRVDTSILKVIKHYNEDLHYTDKAILHTLEWWYDIEKNDVSKANNNIQIVPYIIDRAKAFWQSRTTAFFTNQNIEIKPIENIKVKPKAQKREAFKVMDLSFLEEENNGE